MNNAEEQSGGAPRRSGRRRRRGRQVDGILLLDKPSGATSNKVLQQVKRLYGANKAGHTGSLDPLASGMLPICLGRATKVSSWLLDADKVYEVTAMIGQQTDTADADGKVIATAAKQSITADELEAAMAGLRGDIEQVPPMYSALKKDGRRLYELARQGQEIERQPRCVTVHELEVINFDPQQPALRVRCSKGTYVRTLVEDIAASMSTLAHVAALRRTGVEPFGERPMITLAELEEHAASGASAVDALLEPIDSALQRFPALQLSAGEAAYIGHGRAIEVDRHHPQGQRLRLYAPDGVLLGMGEALDDGRVVPLRVFAPAGDVAK